MRKNIIRVMILVMMLVMVSVQAFAYVYYNQKNYYDYSYTSIGDSSQTIGSSGCGPTSLAMVIANLGNKIVTPVDIAKECVSKGWRTADKGTAHGAFETTYWTKYAVTYLGNYGSDQTKAEKHIKNGGMFVVGTPGHIMAAGYSGDSSKPFKILDPWGGEYNGNYTYSQLKSSSFSRRGAVGSLWAFASLNGRKFDPQYSIFLPEIKEYSLPSIKTGYDIIINGKKVNSKGKKVDIDLDEDNIQTIVLKATEENKDYVTQWVIYKADGTPEYLNGGPEVTIDFGSEGYKKYVNPENNILTLEQIVGGRNPSKETVVFELKNIPVKQDFEVYINNKSVNVAGCENNAIKNFGVEKVESIKLEDKSNIKNWGLSWVIYRADGTPEYLGGGTPVINCGEEGYAKYINPENNLITIEQIVGGKKIDKKVIAIRVVPEDSISDGIAMILSGKEYEATKENPIYTGAIFDGIVLENRTNKNIEKWEIMNEVTGKYELCKEGTNNKQEIFTVMDNYEEVENNKYKLTIRATYTDGTEEIKEIYLKVLHITNIANNDIVSANEDLKIKWSGEAGKEYYIRMVKLSEAGDKYNTEIEPGKILTGSEYVVPAQKLEKNCKYRIALKESNAQYYHIIVVSTMEVNEVKIENYNEIKTHTAGEELKLKLSGKEAGDMYQVILYDAEGRLMWVQNTAEDEMIIMTAEEAVRGQYKLGVSISRQGISSEKKMFDITIR